MFAHVAAAMGHCVAIKSEDAGDVYVMDSELRAPDFRIVTSAGRELLVEVKNHRPPDPTCDYTFKTDYFDSLRRYAAVFQRDLYFAIYWSHWKLWSLVRHDRFDVAADVYQLSLGEAMKRSEMEILGDCMLGTVPPLELRLFSDPDSPRRVETDGTTEFRVGAVQLFAGGEAVEDPLEQRIAWFLMSHGDWPCAPGPAEVRENELISIGLEVTPDKRANPGQAFEVIGFMSQMLSRQYDEMTVGNEGVDLLIPTADPGDLGVMIPSAYKGEKLPLWRFCIGASVPEPDV
jgi:hypothetical protein